MARRRNSLENHPWLHAIARTGKRAFLSTWVAIAAIILTVVAFNHLGAINWALDALGRSYIAEANSVYLHKAKLDMAGTILTLTGLDTGLEVLKSSTAGISFIAEVEVQVGNIVATVQDAAQKALIASLIAAGSLTAIELLLELAAILSVPLLTLTILITGLHYITRLHWRWMARVSGQLSEILMLFTLFVHFGFPLAIYGTSLAADAITAPVAHETQRHFERTSKDFPRSSKSKINTHVKSVINHYKETSANAHNKGRLLSHSVVRHITVVIFNSFIFPGFLIFLVLWVTKMMIRHALRVKELINEDQTARSSAAKRL